MGSENNGKDSDAFEWLSELDYDTWLPLTVSGSQPSARYKHDAIVANGKLYVVGGSRKGRHLADIQMLDLKTLTWSTMKLHFDSTSGTDGESRPQDIFPPMAGHSVIHWRNKLILLGGYSRESSDLITVRAIDLESHHCSILKTSGKVPIARGGQSVTLVGSRLIIFGGDDARKRQLLNDIHILDLETMTWDMMRTLQTPPAPRFDHTAAVYAERYLLIFGGCSYSTCFGDLHILDLETMEWSQPQVQGAMVSPRAGHAGVAIGENWFIVGGGDNKSGAPETLVLDMSKLVWSVLTCVDKQNHLACEGLSLSSTTLRHGENLLVAFGGYYGEYINEVYVMKLRPRDLPRPKIFQSPAAAAAAASVSAAYALIKKTSESKSDGMIDEDEAFNGLQMEHPPADRTCSVEGLMEAKKILEISIADVINENSRIKGELIEVNNTHAELSKELLSVRGQLAAELSRCFKLEAQIAELGQALNSMQFLENELELLRRPTSGTEQDTDIGTAGATHGQSSGGVWQWIAGGKSKS